MPEERYQEIETVIAELRRVWLRNPAKRLSLVMLKAQSKTSQFMPSDATDAELLRNLKAIGPGQPAPEPLPSLV